MSAMTAAGPVGRSAAMSFTATVFRMNVLTCHSAQEGRNESFSAALTCMYIEPYDAETVPQDHQERGYFQYYSLHFNLQMYKNILMCEIFVLYL